MPPDQTDRSMQILLVDDNKDDILLTTEAFREANIQVEITTAHDGIEALETLRQKGIKQPDLILLDLNMPRKDGRETLAEIKSDALLKRIPVVVLSTSSSEDDINAVYDLHANSYIIKHIDFDHLVEAITHLTHFWFKSAKLPNVS